MENICANKDNQCIDRLAGNSNKSCVRCPNGYANPGNGICENINVNNVGVWSLITGIDIDIKKKVTNCISPNISNNNASCISYCASNCEVCTSSSC